MKFAKLVKAKNDYKIEEVGNGNWQVDVPGVGGGQILKVDKFSTLDAVSNYEVILWDNNSEMLPKKYVETFREAKAIVMNHLKSQKSADKIEAKEEDEQTNINNLPVKLCLDGLDDNLLSIYKKIDEIWQDILYNKNEQAAQKASKLKDEIYKIRSTDIRTLWMEITKLYFEK